MRISLPFTSQFAAMAGLMQGSNQAADRAQRLSLALAQQKLAEREQGHREDFDTKKLQFEKYRFDEEGKRDEFMERLRNALMAEREMAGYQSQAGLQDRRLEAEASEGELERQLRRELQEGAQAFQAGQAGLDRAHAIGMEELRAKNAMDAALASWQRELPLRLRSMSIQEMQIAAQQGDAAAARALQALQLRQQILDQARRFAHDVNRFHAEQGRWESDRDLRERMAELSEDRFAVESMRVREDALNDRFQTLMREGVLVRDERGKLVSGRERPDLIYKMAYEQIFRSRM